MSEGTMVAIIISAFAFLGTTVTAVFGYLGLKQGRELARKSDEIQKQTNGNQSALTKSLEVANTKISDLHERIISKEKIGG